ncbi:MAG: hypothetical protein MIO92_08720 [Methanosarcinaceae archaeon]|nr:hypothetical protein [Methanosarcinaceae archaeon]
MTHKVPEKKWAILKTVLSLLIALSLFTLPGCGLNKEDEAVIKQGVKAAEESKAAASRAEAATKRLEDLASRLELSARSRSAAGHGRCIHVVQHLRLQSLLRGEHWGAAKGPIRQDAGVRRKRRSSHAREE